MKMAPTKEEELQFKEHLAIFSNAPYIWKVDCDHYINNSKALQEAMCFMMNSISGSMSCCIQLPQRSVQELVKEKVVQVYLPVRNTMIDMYARCGSLDKARRVGDDEKGKGDVTSSSGMTDVYTVNECSVEAPDNNIVLLWVRRGLVFGYSSHLYKMFEGTYRKKNTLKTSSMFPIIVFSIFLVLNGLIWEEKSSSTVLFGTIFALVFLWIGIAVSLVFVGSYLDLQKPVIEDSIKKNKLPRQIYALASYMQHAVSVLAGGLYPFGADFIKLLFILTM